MIHQLTASELADKLRHRELGAVEVTEAFLDRCESENGHYNAFLQITRDQAMESAQRAQQAIDSDQAGPLCGIPVAIKDNISTRGVATTCASRILEGYVPPFDATVIQQLENAGAIVVGKTNMDEFAMGTTNENSAFGPVLNPWDTDRVTGGSSGGSAAAVSGELAPLALGSDTGGSIRLPAAWCGVVGFKPTYGRVSRYGLIAFASSLDQIGPFGKTVEDVALIASAISGHDPNDNTSLPDGPIRTEEIKNGHVKGLKIGVPEELIGDAIEPQVREVFEVAIDVLRREGAEIKMLHLPSVRLGVTTYYIIAPSEASSNLARFDGVRFGPRIEEGGYIESFSATRGRLFGDEVKLRIMVGTFALSSGYYEAYYQRAQIVRGLMTSEIEGAFNELDFILTPTAPIVAPKVGGIRDNLAQKTLDLCTIPANMGGFPSISIPCGLAHDLPVGLQIMGPQMSDERLLQCAFAVDRALGRDYRRPPIL